MRGFHHLLTFDAYKLPWITQTRGFFHFTRNICLACTQKQLLIQPRSSQEYKSAPFPTTDRPSPSGLHHKVQNRLLGTLPAIHNPCYSSFIVPQLSYIYILTSLQHDLCRHRTETCLVIWSSACRLPQELVYARLKASSQADANIRSSLP